MNWQEYADDHGLPVIEDGCGNGAVHPGHVEQYVCKGVTEQDQLDAIRASDDDEDDLSWCVPGTWLAIRYQPGAGEHQAWMALMISEAGSLGVILAHRDIAHLPEELEPDRGKYAEIDTWVLQESIKDGTTIILRSPDEAT